MMRKKSENRPRGEFFCNRNLTINRFELEIPKIAACNLIDNSTASYIRDEGKVYVVNSMYTKSEIREISMEIDQCMCCAAMVPIIGIGDPIAN